MFVASWPRAAAAFSALMAIMLAGTWIGLFASSGVPELETKPFSTWSLLAAEFGTAGLLLVGAVGLLGHRRWAGRVSLAALGMLLYTTVNTVGVSAEQDLPAVAVFMAVVAAASATLIVRSFHEPSI